MLSQYFNTKGRPRAGRRSSANDRSLPFWLVLAAVGLSLAALPDLSGKSPGSGRLNDRPGQHPPDGAARAVDPARGHQAGTPSEIPARGWWHIFKRVAGQISGHRLMAEAAGVTFYALLAIFPALAALVSIYGFFASPANISKQLDALSGVVPGGGMQIISDQLHSLANTSNGALSVGAVIGILISLWSANAGMKAMFDALNVVYDEKEKRSFIRLTLVSLCFTLGALAFVLIALAAIVVVPIVLNFIGLGQFGNVLVNALRWPGLLIVITIFLAFVYRFGPSRDEARWRWVSWGGAFAAIGWLIVSAAFSWYVSNFGSYNKTYGSLGAAVGFMTWIWLSSLVILIGAQLNAEMEYQTARDTTTGPEQPMGRRGATRADEVAAA
ncbi:MAG: YihY/virulence factor BrkB family protein [Acetobacteraceae bacterium]|nr:YihY/virulence factor BrkB family protein [Acetobacteraceae bacterium]